MLTASIQSQTTKRKVNIFYSHSNMLSILCQTYRCLKRLFSFKWGRNWNTPTIYIWYIVIYCHVYCLFRATLVAYGGSHATGWIGAVAAGPCHSRSNARSEPRLQSTPQLMATGSLTHWVRPGIKPASSWILVILISAELQRELPTFNILIWIWNFLLLTLILAVQLSEDWKQELIELL